MTTNKSADILENTIYFSHDLLSILLLDRTKTNKQKRHNIIWGTNSYQNHCSTDEIYVDDITGNNTYLIKPRIVKTKQEQKNRKNDKAEIFTPRNIVHQMNQSIDWRLGHWPVDKNNWQNYVSEFKLEITCGEAPFIVGRYNAVNGKKVLNLNDRVGFLDRKLQVVTKYASSKNEWIEWAIKAYQASYGYEWQGDNLLLARENLLYTFIDYWNDKFPTDKINLERKVSDEKMQLLLKIAEIISWNIFQMDGLRYVIPMSCKHEVTTDNVPPMMLMLGEKPIVHKNECPGCKLNDPTKHNGKYVKIMDWKKGKPIKFVNLIRNFS